MIRRLSLTKRRSSRSVTQDLSGSSAIREGCPEFVSWDSDDGMFDLAPPVNQSTFPGRTSSLESLDEQGENTLAISGPSLAAGDDIFRHMWSQEEAVTMLQSGGIAIATATAEESHDIIADFLVESVADSSKKQEKAWTKSKKKNKRRRSSLHLSLNNVPGFTKKKKKKGKLSASALV